MYPPLQSERLYEQIVDRIEHLIMTGELKVGDRLPAERELAERFAVSRTVVREAVKALHEKGLVEILLGRGTFITNGIQNVARQSLSMLMKFESAEGYRSLEEVREILEPEIAALAATRVSDGDITAMAEAVAVMDTALENVDMFVEADLDFHLALAEATRNPIIPILMDSIIDLLREQRKLTGLVDGGLARGQSHHKKILAAVIQRDAQTAKQAMHTHLQQVRDDSHASSANKA